jgi:long-chain acyl-CoA synthetase
MLQLEKNNLFSLITDKINKSTFFFYKEEPISYEEAYKKIISYSNFLKEANVAKGDRIILALPNRPEFIFIYLAIARLGAISVLVNPGYKVFELKHIIDDCNPTLVITEKSKLKNYIYENSQIINQNKLIAVDEISLSYSNSTEKEDNFESLSETDTASIIYTSAMDSQPLGAMLSHFSIFRTIEEMIAFSSKEDSFLSVLPLYHSFGLITTFLLPLCYGQTFYLVDSFDPNIIVSTITKNKITSVIGVPLLFKVLNMFLKKENDYSFLRLCISGGEAIEKSIQVDFQNKFNVELREGYGITEASPIVTWNQITVKNKIGSVGPAMPWNIMKVVNKKVINGIEVGEIAVKGVNIFQGYYNQPHETEKYLNKDGWFYTGDLGYIDDEGYLYLTGIKKKMLLNNGLNVYPSEVEKILLNHNDIDSVQCKIEKHGSRDKLSAYITSQNESLNAEDLKEWCKKFITKYKIPKSFIIN